MDDEFTTADVIRCNDIEKEMKNHAMLFRKLQKARLDFLEKHIEARGRNNFNNFDYIQLRDIVQYAIPVLYENDLSIHHRFYEEKPVVDVVDTETGYTVTFGSNFNFNVDGKNQNQRLQSLGSAESYERRYIYMQILDIVEADPDSEFGKEEATMKPRITQKTAKPVVDVKEVEKKILPHIPLQHRNNENILEEAGKQFQSGQLTREEFRAIKNKYGGNNV